MAEKSLPNPDTSVPTPAAAVLALVLEELGVAQVMEVLDTEDTEEKVDPPHVLSALPTLTEVLEGVAAVLVMAAAGLTFPRREGGIMACVSPSGMSFLRTFSAMRYMARANCSAFRRPFFSISHKFLGICTWGCSHWEGQCYPGNTLG